MKTLHKTVFLLAFTIILSPMVPFWLGDYYEQKMEDTQDEDKISKWRNARLFYRQAQIVPWLWLPVEKRKRNIDNHLSQSMYEIILIGESGAFDATQHLDFIQSREDTSSWQEGATEALYRYGDCDDIIDNYENNKKTSHSQKVQQLTMLCAMQLDKQDLFDELYSEKADLDAMAFWAREPKGKYENLLNARSAPTMTNWSTFLEMTSSTEEMQKNIPSNPKTLSSTLLPLWIESYAQIDILIRDFSPESSKVETTEKVVMEGENTEKEKNAEEKNTEETVLVSFSKEHLFSLLTATISKELYPNASVVLSDTASKPYNGLEQQIEKDLSDCMILASALHIPQDRIQHFTKDVLDAYLAENFLPSRLETNLMNKCNPQYYYNISKSLMELYHKQKESTEHSAVQSYVSAQWWLLMGARSQLGSYNISTAQKWLKEFDAQSLEFTDSDTEISNAIKMQHVMYLYLRSLAREFAGDLSGIEKYARLLKESNNSLSVLRMGKANLLRQQKAETIWILYGEKDLLLPENLKQEHSDLGAIAQRMNGSGNKMILNGEDIKYGLLERSTDFRVWYANHLNQLLQYPHKNISTLSLLINNARADKDGPSLLKSHFGSEIHLQSILLRQHLVFLFNSFKGNNTSESWNNFSVVQKRWEKMPFPQLWKELEFRVQLEEIVDFESLLEDL